MLNILKRTQPSTRAQAEDRAQRLPQSPSALFVLSTITVILLGTFCCPAYGDDLEDYCEILKLCNLPCHTKNADITFKLRTYSIAGTTAKKLQKEIKAKGPVGLKGKRWDAFFKWKIKWKWHTYAGRALFVATQSFLDAELIIPEAQNQESFSPAMKKSWDNYYCTLLRHEENHFKNAKEGYPTVSAAVRKAYDLNPKLKSKEANQVARRALNKIRKADLKYDRDTEHGKREGLRLE